MPARLRSLEDLRKEPGTGSTLSAGSNAPVIKRGLKLAGLNGGPGRGRWWDFPPRTRPAWRRFMHIWMSLSSTPVPGSWDSRRRHRGLYLYCRWRTLTIRPWSGPRRTDYGYCTQRTSTRRVSREYHEHPDERSQTRHDDRPAAQCRGCNGVRIPTNTVGFRRRYLRYWIDLAHSQTSVISLVPIRSLADGMSSVVSPECGAPWSHT